MTIDDESRIGGHSDRQGAVEEWLKLAEADADRRHLPELKVVLRQFARATVALRSADLNLHA